MIGRARSEIAGLAALGIIALGTILFLALADETTEIEGQAFDQSILLGLRAANDPSQPVGPWWLKEAAADLTSLGGISVLGLFALIAVLFLLIQKKRLSALLMVIGLSGGVALSEGLKAIVGRARPPEAFQAVETLNASFPSGHALLATVFYLGLGVLLAEAMPRRRLKAFMITSGIVIAIVIGLTRIYLGAHWTTDVIAGWAVGAAWAMVLWLVSHLVVRFDKGSGTRQYEAG